MTWGLFLLAASGRGKEGDGEEDARDGRRQGSGAGKEHARDGRRQGSGAGEDDGAEPTEGDDGAEPTEDDDGAEPAGAGGPRGRGSRERGGRTGSQEGGGRPVDGKGAAATPEGEGRDEKAAGRRKGGTRPRTGGSRASEHRPHGSGEPGGDPDREDQVATARRKLEDAIRRGQESGSAGREVKPPSVGQKVDKYFGTKLPPVCARLGCYLTDDGKRFYCVNPSCQKHKKRDTKHTRRAPRPGKGAKQPYFRCPQCGSRDVDLHIFASKYECRRCGRKWERDASGPAEEE